MTEADIQESAETPEPEEKPEPAAVAGDVAAPEAEPAPAAPASELPVTKRAWSHAPFFVLGAAWIGFVAALTVLLWDSAAVSIVGSPLYPYFVFGGVALVLIGFVTGLTVWLLARGRVSDDERAGVAGAIWLRAVAWTAGGVALWWVGLILLDLHRAGVIG